MDPEFGITTVLRTAMPIMGQHPVLPQCHGLATSCWASLLMATVASLFSVSGMIVTTPALTRWLR